MPLTEIIRKADCSVGAFYGRFDGKESLFHHVQGYVLNEGVQWIDQQIDLFMNNKIDTVKNITTEDAARFIVTLLRSEEYTYELQSLLRISYDVFCLKKKKN